MAKEFENYESMAAEATGLEQEWEARDPADLVMADDLAQVEARFRDIVDAVMQRFDELHERVWRLEDRISRLEARDSLEGRDS